MLYSVHNCYIAGGCRGWYENGSPGLYSINCYIASLACTLVSRCYIILLHVILHWIMPFISWYIWCSNSLLLHLAGPGPGSPCTTCYITWYTPYSDSETVGVESKSPATDPSWIWEILKLDEMNCFKNLWSIPCPVFSSITFESFGTDSETRQPAPAGKPTDTSAGLVSRHWLKPQSCNRDWTVRNRHLDG